MTVSAATSSGGTTLRVRAIDKYPPYMCNLTNGQTVFRKPQYGAKNGNDLDKLHSLYKCHCMMP